MSKKPNRTAWKRIIEIVIAVSILTVSLPAFALSGTQDNVESKIAEAVTLFQNKQIQKAIFIFREVGDPAVPTMMNLLQTEIGSMPSIQMMLLSSITFAQGKQSDAALLTFLSDKSPYIRGFAATNIGERKLKAAVPQLINLLNDTEAYLFMRVTHPYGYDKEPSSIDVPIPVRDKAIDALQLITGKKLAKGKSREKQAAAWLQWWQKQREWK